MQYFIGMDGGGSNTVAVLGDAFGILVELTGTASNYHNVGVEGALKTFATLITALCEKAHIDQSQVVSICLGGAGVDTPEDKSVVTAIFRALGYQGHLQVVNDSEIALVAANGTLEGALLISGTGSIAIGANQGKLYRTGGWGQVIGDEGSGYAIARDALVAIAKSADGRIAPNGLFEALKGTLKAESPDDVIQFVYGSGQGKDAIAALTPLVIEASAYDPVAQDILTSNARDLVEMVSALVPKMESDQFVLSVSGSVLMKSDVYFELFKKAIGNFWPNIKVQRSTVSPVTGAYQMALKLKET